MKSEGWKLSLALAAVAALFLAGSFIVRPFPWLKAYEYSITGNINIAGKNYFFSKDNPLIIDNVRVIKGFAVAEDGTKVYFDNQGGAEVKADQIGYLEGIIYSPENGILEIGLLKNRLAKIDSAGNLSGDFLLDDGKQVVLAGKTSWRSYELNKISLPDKIDLGINASSRLDPVILGLGGRDLYDVQTRWLSNDNNVSVDEYGYVTARKPGLYQDVIILQVGEEKKAVSLQATQGIDKIAVKPSVVVAPSGAQTFDLTFDPASKGEEIRGLGSSVTVTGEFVNSSGKKVTCGSYDKEFKQLKGCIFAVAEDAGLWNLEFTIDEGGGQKGKYVFPGVLTVVKKDSAISMSLLANVYNDLTAGNVNPDNIIAQEDDYKFIEYKLVVNWPSYIVKDSKVNGSLTMSFKGSGVDVAGANMCQIDFSKTPAPVIPGQSMTYTFSNHVVQAENETFTFSPRVTMNAVIPQGCDFVASLPGVADGLNITFPDGATMNGVKGNAEVRTAVEGRKRVSVTGDVIVEEGDLQIKRLDEDQNLYLLVASEGVSASGGQGEGGSVSDYQLSQDSTYNKMISTLRDKVNKLVIERGTTVDLNDVNELEKFLLIDKQKNPEGRILVANNASGEVILNNNIPGDLMICAPTTLVVYGRNVKVQDNIRMQSDNDSTCVERGNFGLIVFDGDIIFDGSVDEVEGFYFTTGTIHTGLSHEKFALKGVAFAHDYVLERY